MPAAFLALHGGCVYGSRRIRATLQAQGVRIGQNH